MTAKDGKTIRVLITGDREELEGHPAVLADGRTLEWVSLSVLRFERLPVDPALVDALIAKPVDWIVFTSPRAARFWSEVILENQVDFPLETQVACIGEATAEAATQDGFNPDFYPTEPGTEGFLREFEDLLSNTSVKPRVVIPQAEGGRTAIARRLSELGCTVQVIPLYRTLPREDLAGKLSSELLASLGAILFTSPSSVDAFRQCYDIPRQAKIVALGRFTGEHLKKMGLERSTELPEGDVHRIGEVL